MCACVDSLYQAPFKGTGYEANLVHDTLIYALTLSFRQKVSMHALKNNKITQSTVITSSQFFGPGFSSTSPANMSSESSGTAAFSTSSL